MNVKRTALLALTAVVLGFALAGCSNPLDTACHAALYDDDDAIAQREDSYSVVDYRGPRLDDAASTLGDIHIGGLSGSMTLLAFDAPAGGDLAISCDMEAVHGDIKLVFAALDDRRVETLCEGEASGSLARKLEPGRYALKVVAVGGGADVTVQASASNDIEAFIPGDMLDDSPIPVSLDPLEA